MMNRALKMSLLKTSEDLVSLAHILLRRADNIQKLINRQNQLVNNPANVTARGNERNDDENASSDSSDEESGGGETMTDVAMAYSGTSDSDTSSTSQSSTTDDEDSLSDQSSISNESQISIRRMLEREMNGSSTSLSSDASNF